MVELMLWAVALYFGAQIAFGLLAFVVTMGSFCLAWGKAIEENVKANKNKQNCPANGPKTQTLTRGEGLERELKP